MKEINRRTETKARLMLGKLDKYELKQFKKIVKEKQKELIDNYELNMNLMKVVDELIDEME